MHLDMITMSAVDVTVTTVLGLVLLFTWSLERDVRLVGWWGLVMSFQAAGIVTCAGASLADNARLITFGLAVMMFSDAIKWTASREFAKRSSHVAWALVLPLLFLGLAYSGIFQGLRGQFLAFSMLSALLNLAAAFELARTKGESLVSHLPAVVLLLVTAVVGLSLVPMAVTVPFDQPSVAYASGWFATANLVMIITRIALAFVVLAMAKQRQEMEHRVNALTDTLTGLPNRRALYEKLDALEHKRSNPGPLSVLFFDLDRFKEINDTFGHTTGDRVLKLFAATATANLEAGSVIARMGGEEFAALLMGVRASAAVACAEDVRRAFAQAVDRNIGATVSVGVATGEYHIRGRRDVGALLRQADSALYAAKRGGRNRVKLAEPAAAEGLATSETVRKASPKATTASTERPNRRATADA